VSEVWGELQRAAGAAERLIELLETRPQNRRARRCRPFTCNAPRGDVEFDHVRFAYPARPRRPPPWSVFSLRVAPGERLALVGPSGAGKIDGVRAAPALSYDPQQGAVRIDGTDVRKMEPRALRRLIAVVPQEPVIFAASVLDNVRYGAARGEPR